MPVSFHSLVLVALQLGLLLGLAFTGPWWPPELASRTCVLVGFALGLWALATVRLRHLRATPEPAAGAALVRHGPYRWIRHPMYSAILLVVAGWLDGSFNLPRAWMSLALLVVLVVKLRYEERLLRAHFPDYAAYAAGTKKLIPWVW